jgi:hypothetical protein
MHCREQKYLCVIRLVVRLCKPARVALEKGDITPVLKWVQAADEKEIRVAFQKTLAVRAKGTEAK